MGRNASTATNREKKKADFLKALRGCGNVSVSARLAKIDRGTAYRWRNEDDAFAASWYDCLEEATDGLEEEARRRAMAGSDTLLIFMLKANRPEKYRERYDVRAQMNYRHDDSLSDAELARIASGVDVPPGPPKTHQEWLARKAERESVGIEETIKMAEEAIRQISEGVPVEDLPTPALWRKESKETGGDAKQKRNLKSLVLHRS